MANSDSRPFNPDEGEELSFSDILPMPAQAEGERKIAPDILFRRLGPELVKRINQLLPTPRMSQDGIHAVMREVTNLYLNMLHDMTPGSSTPETTYVTGTLEQLLRAEHLNPPEVTDVAHSIVLELHSFITEHQERQAGTYHNEISPEVPYERLRRRDMYRALSTSPWEDARAVAQQLQLSPASNERFIREYAGYVQESHKQHVASAHVLPKTYGVASNRADPSKRVAEAHEAAEELLERMIVTLDSSPHPAFKQGDERYHSIRQFLVHTLHGSHEVPEPRGKINLKEPVDSTFLGNVRMEMAGKGEAMKTRLDTHVSLLQDIADNMLDPNKISKYSNALMHKQGRELAATLQEAGIENSREVAARIVNIFAKQVNLVQSNRPDSPGRT